MNSGDWLSLAALRVGDAIESLTFDRFDWALEEAVHGVDAAVEALGGSGRSETHVASGGLPAPGALENRWAACGEPQLGRNIVEQLEATLARWGDELAAGTALGSVAMEDVSRAVFAASRFVDVVAGRLGLPVPGSMDTVRHGTGPRAVGVPRRRALQWLASGAVLPVAACARPASDGAQFATAEQPAAPAAPLSSPSTPAGVRAVTAIESMQWPTSDPFLFCAHHNDQYPEGNGSFGPAASLAGRVIGRDFDDQNSWRMYHGEVVPGFPRHPHRGFETVTVVRTGLLDHADSMGAAARYGGGDVQWLTAGGGIQHAEMFPLLRADAENPLELFQIWLNLPARDKMVDPYFTMLWNERIPRVVARDDEERVVEVTVAAGSLGGQSPPSPPPNSWASRPASGLAIWSLRFEPGATFELPEVLAGVERSLYVHRGSGVRVGDRDVPNYHRVELDGPGTMLLRAGAEESEVLLLQGRPIGEPVARRGPFVMNTQAEIQQAYSDYRQTQFGGWPWPGNDPVHGAEPVRFARHVDGRYEEPT